MSPPTRTCPRGRPSSAARRAAASCAIVALLAVHTAGCAAPGQVGGVVVAPGAAERLLLAMRFGHGDLGEAVAPAQVFRATDGMIPGGAAANGRAGDVVLENGAIVAIVGAIDGTTRGGRLLDLATKPELVDALEDYETRVLGRAVRYETLRTGRDEATGVAYVSVSAVVDRSAEGLGVATIATRYDVGPGLGAVLVHSQIQVVAPPEPGRDAALVVERLRAHEGGAPMLDASHAAVASLGVGRALALRALDAEPTAEEPRFEPRAEGVVAELGLPSSFAGVPGRAIPFSRAIVPLERPDGAALAVANAQMDGQGVGEVAVRLVVGAASVARLGAGDLELRSEDGSTTVARGLTPCATTGLYTLKVPRGTVEVGFSGELHRATRSERTLVESEQTAFVRLPVEAQPGAWTGVPWAAGGCMPSSSDDPGVR